MGFEYGGLEEILGKKLKNFLFQFHTSNQLRNINWFFS